MQDGERKIPIHFGVKGQGHNRTLSTLWFWQDNLSNFQHTAFKFHTYMQYGERKIHLHFGSKVKVTMILCQHFGSDTITWVLFNIQLSYFIHRCRIVRRRYLYIFGSKVKVTMELCQHFGSDTITSVIFNIQLSYFIHRCRMVRGRYLCILGSKFKVTSEYCQHFGSDTITWVVFNVRLSYFIHRCRMVKGRYLYILGSKVKVTSEHCQHFGSKTITWVESLSTYSFHISYVDAGWWEEDTFTFWVKGQDHNGTLLTLWFWHDNLSSFQCTAFIFHT